jgi:hypothetical protein
MNTSYADSICIATQSAYFSDLPTDLMPLYIAQNASMLAGFDSDECMGATCWSA